MHTSLLDRVSAIRLSILGSTKPEALARLHGWGAAVRICWIALFLIYSINYMMYSCLKIYSTAHNGFEGYNFRGKIASPYDFIQESKYFMPLQRIFDWSFKGTVVFIRAQLSLSFLIDPIHMDYKCRYCTLSEKYNKTS